MARIMVFGATGRVGQSFIKQTLGKGHRVTAFVRTPTKFNLKHPDLEVIQGDIYNQEAVNQALKRGFDIVVNVVGADPLKPSTVVQDAAKALVEAMPIAGLERYLGITGTAQMRVTAFGRFSQFMVRRFIAAAADHQKAYEILQASDLDYALAACPYIKDGSHTGKYHLQTGPFPGGFKTISPQDVADFLSKEVDQNRYHREAVGIWY